MKKIKPYKEKPGLKRFEVNIYWANGQRVVSRKMVAPNHEMVSENLMRSLNLQFKRSRIVVIGTSELGPAY